jgi:PIN domain nuclease of toxin-antitoxin system
VKLLLDTNALFWWLIDPSKLLLPALNAISARDYDVYVSVASAWEIAIKVGISKWPEARALLNDFEGLVRSEHFRLLPVSVAHVRDAGLMQNPHRDPFDRLLAAQSIREELTIVTPDPVFPSFEAPCLW